MNLGPWCAFRARVVIPLVFMAVLAPLRSSYAADVNDCGTLALYSLLHIEGRPIDLRTLANRLSSPGQDGHSMKALRDTARMSGLELRGVQLKKDPRAIDRPMLVYLKEGGHGHYIVIRPVGHTGTLVQIIDSNRPLEIMDKVDLVASPIWTGLALVPRRANWPARLFGGFFAVTGLCFLLRYCVTRSWFHGLKVA